MVIPCEGARKAQEDLLDVPEYFKQKLRTTKSEKSAIMSPSMCKLSSLDCYLGSLSSVMQIGVYFCLLTRLNVRRHFVLRVCLIVFAAVWSVSRNAFKVE